MRVAIDFGITNIDAVVETGTERRYWTFPGSQPANADTIVAVLEAGRIERSNITSLAVTGGRSGLLPPAIGGLPLARVPEIEAIGRGGLMLSGLPRALVVSGGSGTALAAAEATGFEGGRPVGLRVRHVGGTAVGGGTLLGLGRLLLGTASPAEIDTLARAGNAKAADLTIGDVVGGSLGHLPAEATAVNFGRVAVEGGDYRREDVAAAVVTMIAQTIGLLMAKAAEAHGFDRVVITGHLADLPSAARVLGAFGRFFGGEVVIPADRGRATVLGALTA